MKLTKGFNQLIKWTTVLITLSTSILHAQTPDLETCQNLARELSPLKQQEQYLLTIDALNQSITQTYLLPKINLGARAAYQSDVFSLPFSPPAGDVPQIPKDQYQITLGLSQPLYDGGITKAAQKVDKARYSSQKAQVEVSLYQIREIINDLYFGILSLEENRKIVQALIKELDNQVHRAKSALKNGLLLSSELKSLQKERLFAQQQLNELTIRKQALQQVLSDWIGREIPPDSRFSIPEVTEPDPAISRPELKVFSAKVEELQARKYLTASKSRPKVSAFATAGYGNPNPYNFFETDWNSYYMIGGRLEWDLWDWGRTKNQRTLLDLDQKVVLSEKENFEKNIQNGVIRQQGEIRLLEGSLATDQELVDLQKDITRTAAMQFEQGVLSASDYLTELNTQARVELQKSLHQIDLLKAKVTLQTLTGNTP